MSHSCSAMYFSLVVTSMRAELPSGKVPTALVLLLISRSMRSIPLFVLIRRQCSGGNSVQASVSANPSRTFLSLRSAPTSSDVTSSSGALSDPSSTDMMFADTVRGPFVGDLLLGCWKSYDRAHAVFRYAAGNLRKKFCVGAVFQTVRSSDYRLAENNRLLRSSKVSGSNIVSGVHCLVHDVNIRLLTIEFGRLIIGGCHAAKQSSYIKYRK